MRDLFLLLVFTGLFMGCGDLSSNQATSTSIREAISARADSIKQTITASDSLPALSPDDQLLVSRSFLDSLSGEISSLQQTIDQLRGVRAPTEAEEFMSLSSFVIRTIIAVFLLMVFAWLVRKSVALLERLAERSEKDSLRWKKGVPIVRILGWTLAIFLVVYYVYDIDREGFLAAGTALSVGIAFASQDVLKNIFGGIIIIMDQPFQVGDKINVGGTYGEVKSIGLRSTRIVTPDDNLVSVPNAQVVDGQVANANAGELNCQVVTKLFLPGWVDVMQAKQIAYKAAANSKYVYLDKPIVVNIKDEFRETFLTELNVKAYVLNPKYEFLFASEVTETAKTEFQRNGMLPASLEYTWEPPDLDSSTNGGDGL